VGSPPRREGERGLSTTIGTAVLHTTVDKKGLESQMQTLMPGFAKWGKAGGIALGVAAVAAAGVELFRIGGQLQEQTHIIETETGLTGKSLQRLVDIARHVSTTVPASFADSATAVGLLHRRLGLTGGTLFTVTKQVTELSRMTKTGLQDNILGAADAMNRWNIPAKMMPNYMDEIWRASQKTGTAVGDIMQGISRGANTFQKFGLNFSDATALIAKLNQQGVQTPRILMGLNSGLSKIAKAGEDPIKTFRTLVQEINSGKEPTKAFADTVSLFGSRAGPEMFRAIKSGALGMSAFKKQIEEGRGSILASGKATRTFGDQMTLLGNKMKVAVAPAALKVREEVTNMVAFINQHWGPMTRWISAEWTKVWASIGPTVTQTLTAVRSVIQSVLTAIRYIWRRWGDEIRSIVGPLMTWNENTIKRGLKIIRDVFRIAADLMKGDWSGAWDVMKNLLQLSMNQIVSTVRVGLHGLGVLIGGVAGWMGGEARKIGSAILNNIVSEVKALPGQLVDLVRAAINAVIDKVNGFTLPSVHIPGVGKIGGGHPFDIPHVATGAVISTPTLVLAGETARARPEIITPEHLLRQIMREEGAGGVGDVHVYIGDREVTDIVRVEVKKENKRTARRVRAGKTVWAGAQ